jgi:hypothetical protein
MRNREKGSKENSYPNTADQDNSSYNQHLTNIHHIKQTSSNTHEKVRSSTSRYDHIHLLHVVAY